MYCNQIERIRMKFSYKINIPITLSLKTMLNSAIHWNAREKKSA